MVQKALKKNGNAKVKKSASSLKKNVAKSKQAKVGSLLKLPNKHYREVALEERALSKVYLSRTSHLIEFQLMKLPVFRWRKFKICVDLPLLFIGYKYSE